MTRTLTEEIEHRLKSINADVRAALLKHGLFVYDFELEVDMARVGHYEAKNEYAGFYKLHFNVGDGDPRRHDERHSDVLLEKEE